MMQAARRVAYAHYLGPQRSFPSYNVMGLAKASLEANVAHAQSSGQGIGSMRFPRGRSRRSPLPAINSIRKLLAYAEKQSPLRRNVSTEKLAMSPHSCAATWPRITGEITYVDRIQYHRGRQIE